MLETEFGTNVGQKQLWIFKKFLNFLKKFQALKNSNKSFFKNLQKT